LIYQLLLHADGQSTGSRSAAWTVLRGFLEKELAEGSITVERAQELTDAFILKLGDYFSVMRVVTHPSGTLAKKSKYNYVCGRTALHGRRPHARRTGRDQHADAAVSSGLRAAVPERPVHIRPHPQ
jgi:hypothetical protein